MNLQLSDRQVVITGGSKGIGLSIALNFAREGARPVLVSRNEATLAQGQAAFAQAGLPAPQVAAIDLSAPGSAQQLFDRFPKADILVNNAGAIPGGGPSSEYAAFIAREQTRWREVVIKGQIKPG